MDNEMYFVRGRLFFGNSIDYSLFKIKYMQLESNFGMNEEVEFLPRLKQCQEIGIEQEPLDGTIKGIRFTEAKVFYDVYNPYYGIIFTSIQSQNVKKETQFSAPLAEVE
jgi:hypothetical protein